MRLELESEEKKRMDEMEKEMQKKEEEKKPLNFLQRTKWLWDYYKWYVIIPLAVICVFIYGWFCFIKETGPVYLRATMINAVMSDESEVTFDDAFMDYVKPDESLGSFALDTGLVHPKVIDDTNSGDTVLVASVQKYNALLTNGDTDITISSDWVIEQFAPSGSYYSLKDVLPDALYKKLEERIYFCQGPSGEIPVGIRLYGVDEIMKFYEGQEIPVIAISSRTKHLEHVLLFLDWLVE